MSEVKRKDEIQGDIIHEYDGIEEADNALPNWWLWIFYGTIVFSTLYWLGLHELGSLPLIDEEYAQASEAAQREAERAGGGPVTDESLVALSHDAAAVAEGKTKFVAMCVACHAERGEGRIGPNLTDRYWINGGSPTQIYAVISGGAPRQPMMVAWEKNLGKRTTQRVAAYVLSLRNTNVAGKAPQGTSWPEGEPAPADPAAADGGTPPPAPAAPAAATADGGS